MAAKSAEARWARGVGLQRDVMLAHSRAKLTILPIVRVHGAEQPHLVALYFTTCTCQYLMLV